MDFLNLSSSVQLALLLINVKNQYYYRNMWPKIHRVYQTFEIPTQLHYKNREDSDHFFANQPWRDNNVGIQSLLICQKNVVNC